MSRAVAPCTVCGAPVEHHAAGDLLGLPAPHRAPCGTPCVCGAELTWQQRVAGYHRADGCPAEGCGGGWPR